MDAKSGFHRFMDLPKELREQIYIQLLSSSPYQASYGSSKRPCEPPITGVSRLLREETIPLYYSTFPLTTRTYVKCASYGQVWLTTNKWYHKLGAKIKHIRLLNLQYKFVERYFGGPVMIQFSTTLDKRSGSYAIKHSFGPGWWSDANRKGDPADCEEVVSALRNHICTSLDTLILKPGIGGLEADHLDELIHIDPDKLKEVSNL